MVEESSFAGADGSATGEGSGTGATTEQQRQRRYAELLREPPPPPPVTAAREEPPSFLSRLFEPIAAALRPNPTRSREQQRAVGTTSDAPADASPVPAGKEVAQGERNHDVVPPILLAAEFLPAEVEDGSTTVLVVRAADALSGVRAVSGVLINPTGSTMGFACRREGESDRWTMAFEVPEDAAAGVWLVQQLTLVDFAGNNAVLPRPALPASAAFRVRSNAPDAEPPALRAAWPAKPAMRAGEPNRIHVIAEDDRSGVLLVSGSLTGPSRRARLPFNCSRASGDQWDCDLSPPTCLDCGVWQLEQIHVQDNAGNTANYRGDHDVVSGVRVDIGGEGCDSKPPVLASLAVDPPVVSNDVESVVRVTLIASDEGCGVGSIQGQAVPAGGVGGQRAFFTASPAGDGRTFTGTLVLRPRAATGRWSINWLQMSDKGFNVRVYGEGDPALARGVFDVR